MKAYNVISLAAISTFSAAAMALAPTVPRPAINAPVVVPMARPGAVGQAKPALPSTATLESAQTAEVVGETCDPRKMYADVTAGTTFAPEVAQELVQDNIIQVAGLNCGKDSTAMSRDARQVWLGTAMCAKNKGIMQVGDYNTRVQILSGCQAGEKNALGMKGATPETEVANVNSIIEQCGLYKKAANM